jgi:putative hemin transport protein
MQRNATPTPTPSQDPAALHHAWRALLASEPRLRIRDAAARLAVREAELRATECGGQTTRLHDDFREIVLRLPQLGEVMALTRNASAVHEKVGVYRDISFHGQQGLVLGHDIDLRLFMARWDSAFAVDEGEHASLHFFDAHGEAVHKVHLRDGSDRRAFADLVAMFRADDQQPHQRVTPAEPAAPPRPDEDIDVAKFQASWLAMQDTHEFFGLLRRHGLARTQALRLAPPDHARRVADASLRAALERSSAFNLPIMIFVANAGCIQIHTGPVARVVPMGPWINVMDPGFNLHLREDHIAATWVVRKPTSDGVVTSLELFDADGGTIALVFGARKPGRPEDPAWRELTDALAAPP